jgi:acetylornithine deacetylase
MSSKPPPLLQRIQQLIATPSVSSVDPGIDQGNRAVIDLLAGWVEDLGLSVEVLPLPGQPGKANLIATLGSGPGGLVLSGHTDTVPYDQGLWDHDPFGGQVDGNRIYGLGSADMKSFLALAIETITRFRASDLRHPVILLATADEESSMAGARALTLAGRPKARHAVIGEPTGLRPIRMHKGIAMETIRLTGRAGHSSDPALGINALEAMHVAIARILAWRESLQSRHRNPLFAVPVPTLNLGHIHGGDNPNRICGQCELRIDIRPLPGMDIDDLRAELASQLSSIPEQTGARLEIEHIVEGVPSFETDPNAAIVKAAEALTGHAAGSVAFGTEGPFLNTLGMETVVMGPGHIDQAHQPDEYIALDMLEPTVDLLGALIRRFCIESQESTVEPVK